MDFTAAQPTTLQCDGLLEEAEVAATPPLEDGVPAGRRPRGQFVSGLTLFAIGSASLVVGYTLLAPRATAAESWVREVDSGGQDTSDQQKWFDLGSAIVVTSTVAGATLVTAMPLALPERAKTPWWAWLSGAAGLGLAGFSIAYGVTADAAPVTGCDSSAVSSADVRTCVSRGEQTSLAILTGVTAAPLITMPLVYLLRPSKARLEPSVEVGRSGGYFALRGRF
jgi:hypothetical protein